MRQNDLFRPIWSVIALIAGAFAVFSFWPEIDLWVSGLTFDPVAKFWIDELPLAQAVRQAIWWLSIGLVLFAIFALAVAQFRRAPLLGLPQRVWWFILLLYSLAPGLIVNGILKRHWGRARPANVIEFGGTAQFTTPIDITDQCARNCSFVSGEGSAAMALAICVILILHHLRDRISAMAYRSGQAFAVAVFCVGSGLRVVSGRHFLSDTVLAGLIVLLVALLLMAAFKAHQRNPKKEAGPAVDNPGDSPYTPPT